MSSGALEDELHVVGDDDLNYRYRGPTQPAPFQLLKSSLYINRQKKKMTRSQHLICDCEPPAEPDRLGCADDETCQNRQMLIECGKYCACGSQCGNKRFQR